MQTIQYNGKLLDFQETKIMGILNVTPDSFYDGGQNESVDDVLRKAKCLIDEGADIIDVGAVSSRPGGVMLSEEEEWRRLQKHLKALRQAFPHTWLSVDTFRSEIAKVALDMGVDMINDISAGTWDAEMTRIIGDYNVPYVMMHQRGDFQEMHFSYDYSHVAEEVLKYFVTRLEEFEISGVDQIILDPGFGFSKSVEQNFQLLQSLEVLTILDHPFLVGLSRKSMIYKLLQITPQEAINGTTALHMIALQKGASLLRVHDPKEAREVITLHEKLFNNH